MATVRLPRLSTSPVTLGFVTLILAWYGLELWVAPAPESWVQYWFAMQSPAPTAPGWATSLVTHANLVHVLANTFLLGVYGPGLERALGRGRYVGFILLTGYGANVAQAVATGLTGGEVAIAGASGVGYAAMAFLPLWWLHAVEGPRPDVGLWRVWRGAGGRDEVVSLLLGVSFGVAFLLPVLELTPFVAAGRSGSVGHLVGAVLGVVVYVTMQWAGTGVETTTLREEHESR